jgi:hypothetical protein
MQKILIVLFFVSAAFTATAQSGLSSWKELGTLKALSAKKIKTSRWSIGGETLDRNYADYNAYKSYLGPLGAKRLRLQAGWARCERVKGKYDFAWLDSIVNDALSQSVQPWLELSYGNPIYQGGGDAALAGGLPTSPEALAAWDAWVSAMVKHFGGRVHEWEIWNEPDLGTKFTAKDYAVIYARTGDVVRKEQPSARLIGLALCCMNWGQYAQTVVDYLKSVNKLHLLDVVSLHGYKLRPEETYPMVEEVKKVVLAVKPDVQFWQGENGAPSVKKGGTIGALREYDWSELTQAKWDLRRMFGDMGADMEVTNLFTMADLYYGSGDHMAGLNAKGLLQARPDKSIEKAKLMYSVYQNAASLFSGTVSRLKDAVFNTGTDVSAFAYGKNGKCNLLTLWMSSKPAAEDESETKTMSFTVKNVSFKKPVYVDLISGKVYEIPTSQYKKDGNDFAFSGIAVPDCPVVIADKSGVVLK